MRTKDTLKREQIKTVIQDLDEYWPLTLRQVYYRLVAAGIIENRRSSYQCLSKLVVEMRQDESISWDCITDKTRRTSAKRGFSDIGDFVKTETASFLRGYSRCRIQGQDRFIEIWVEKDALSTIFENVAWPYCLRVTTCRGYQSVSKLHEYSERAMAAIEKGLHPLVLYFGDFDASGVDMFEAAQRTISGKFGVSRIDFKRIALTPETIAAYGLPHNPDAVKEGDVRTKAFRAKYGDMAVELDSLHPKDLETIATEAIQAHLDMEDFELQMEIEEEELAKIAALKAKITSMISQELEAVR